MMSDTDKQIKSPSNASSIQPEGVLKVQNFVKIMSGLQINDKQKLKGSEIDDYSGQ